jgi:hypothetical protein
MRAIVTRASALRSRVVSGHRYSRLAPKPLSRNQIMRIRQDIERVHRPDAIATSAGGSQRENGVPVHPAPRSRLRTLFPWVWALGLWGAVIAAGCLALVAPANSPGARGRSVPDWPQNCVIPIDGRHPTLLMFLHPLCPCSSASIDELREIAARCGDRARLHAVMLRTDSLERAGACVVERSLADVPGIQIWQDKGGAVARRFGVLTSGHVLLYDPSGRLTFSGGITPFRGHRGDNLGKSALLAAILNDRCDRAPTPVFGCPLFDFQPTVAEEDR